MTSTAAPLAVTVHVGARLVMDTPRMGLFTTPAVTEVIHPWNGETVYARDASGEVVVATADNLRAIHPAAWATPGTPEFQARVQHMRDERHAREDAERAARVAAERAAFARTC